MDSPTINSHLPMNPREYLVLFCLEAEVRHGYGMIREIEALSHGLVRMDPSNLYRVIRRLMRRGLIVEAAAPAPETDGVKRRYYTVTELGREVVRSEAERLRGLTLAAEAGHLLTGRESR